MPVGVPVLSANTPMGAPMRWDGSVFSASSSGNGPKLSGWKTAGTTFTIDGKTFTAENSHRLGTLLQDTSLPNLFQFEVQPGDIWAPVDTGNGVERSEIECSSKLSYDTPYTTSYMMRIPEPGAKDAGSAGWILFTQLHQTKDAGDVGASPIFSREINTTTRAMIYLRRTSTDDPLMSNPSSTTFATMDHWVWGRWINVVEQHQIDPTGGTGYHRIYHDGILVADTGLINTGYVDVIGPYHKFGIYRDADVSHTVRAQYYFNGGIMR